MVNKIVISTNIQKAVSEAVGAIEHDKLFLLTDETTDRLCRPLIAEIPCMKHAQSIVIGATDTHKNLDTLASISGDLQPLHSSVAFPTSTSLLPYSQWSMQV